MYTVECISFVLGLCTPPPVQRKFHLDHDGACLERAGLILVTPWAAERYQPASPATQLIERVFLELIGHGPTLEQQRESTAQTPSQGACTGTPEHDGVAAQSQIQNDRQDLEIAH